MLTFDFFDPFCDVCELGEIYFFFLIVCNCLPRILAGSLGGDHKIPHSIWSSVVRLCLIT